MKRKEEDQGMRSLNIKGSKVRTSMGQGEETTNEMGGK